MPFNARRETLIIGFAYHSLLKLDKSGKTQIQLLEPRGECLLWSTWADLRFTFFIQFK